MVTKLVESFDRKDLEVLINSKISSDTLVKLLKLSENYEETPVLVDEDDPRFTDDVVVKLKDFLGPMSEKELMFITTDEDTLYDLLVDCGVSETVRGSGQSSDGRYFDEEIVKMVRKFSSKVSKEDQISLLGVRYTKGTLFGYNAIKVYDGYFTTIYVDL